VDDAGAVRGRESVGDLRRVGQDFAEWQLAARKAARERFPVHVFHDEEIDVILPPNVEQGTDVRMRERGDSSGLTLEALTRAGVGGQVARENLESHRAIQPHVACLVDLAHAAGAKCGQDLICTQPGALLQRQANRVGSRWRRVRWVARGMRRVEDSGVLHIGGEQPFHLLPQRRVVATGSRQKRSAVRRRQADGPIE
jgi:hypothetical protein